MTPFLRRGACPSLAAPMPTGDGLLLRLVAPWDGWPPAALASLAEAAGQFGNGVLEVTARGNLQARGFRADDVPRFAAALAAAGIAEGSPVVTVGPLAGRDRQEIADPRPIAAQIAAALSEDAHHHSMGGPGGQPREGAEPEAEDDAPPQDRTGHVATSPEGPPADHRSMGGPGGQSRHGGRRPAIHGFADPGAEPEAGAGPMRHPRQPGDFPRRPKLSPKVSVLVDGGGALHLDGTDADVRLRAADAGDWHLWAGRTHLGRIAGALAARTVLILLQRLAASRPGARMRDLVAEAGVEALRRDLEGLVACPLPPQERPAEPIGQHALRSGVAVGVAGAFGTLQAPALAAFARAASAARALRPAPGRAMLALGLAPTAAEALQQVAHDLGLVTRPDDPRRRIVACPGAPACAAAACATRAVARRLAAHPALLPDGILHLSGCAKGCAHPAPAAVTLVGGAGAFGLIRHGTARADPILWLPPDDVPAALERLK